MHSHRRSALFGAAFIVFLAGDAGAESRVEDGAPPFPPAPPDRVELSTETLELLASHIQEFVDRDDIVGAEVHVIKDRRTVLHRAFGHADREEDRRMEVNSIHCVRSMTKPLVGTAIQMLIDEGRLELDTKVSDLLPAFDTSKMKDVTIEILLTHTSGLPFSTLTKALTDYADLEDVANEAAATGPTFRPGAGFQYSDAGADTLGAVVEHLSGMTAGQFIQDRILGPLDMSESITLLEEDDPRARRIPSAYSGGPGQWSRHWRPRVDPPIFPLFLTSQSLYSTTTDYARFLAHWIDSARANESALISEAAVSRALSPGEVVEGIDPGFPGLEVTYGHLWMLYHSEAEARLDPVIFGHNGSDGTYAWAWPELDLIVLFFTQSRGSKAGMFLERELQTLLIDQDGEAYRARLAAEAEAAKELERFAGLYWDQDVAGSYYVVMPRAGQLVVERPGRFRSELPASDEPGKFGKLQFVGPPVGPATAILMDFDGRVERQERHRPDSDLPDVAEVAAMVRKAHGMEHLSDVGAVLRLGRVQGRMKASLEMAFDATNVSSKMTGGTDVRVFVEGDQAFMSVQGAPFEEQSGPMLEQLVMDHPVVAYGGWERFRQVEVLKRIDEGDGPRLLVRTVADEGPGSTKIIDETTGLVIGEDRLEYLPGMGYVGVQVTYEDFRDVGGMRLPFRLRSKYATALIGEVVIEFDRFEIGDAATAHLVREER